MEEINDPIYESICQSICKVVALLCVSFALLLPYQTHAQRVETTIDTTEIRYGEEIKYTISVTLDSLQQVVFPEGQTFSPFETIEFYPIDTITKNHLFELKKTYGITSFDSGIYNLPKQHILIDDNPIEARGYEIKVRQVEVDTLAQPMHTIKPFIAVKSVPFEWQKLLLWILGISIIGTIIGFFLYKKKKETSEKILLLPPLDEAILALKNLDASEYIQQNNSKEYYSELTTILKRYLDREVLHNALESTTKELMTYLYMLRDSQKVPFNRELLRELEDILKRADLIKFANISHEESRVELDRLFMENMIVETDRILPREEEEMKDEERLEKLKQEHIKKKRKQRTWLIGSIATLGVIVIGFFLFSYFNKNSSLEYDDSNWITSAYGYPPLVIKTPEVLVRSDEFTIQIPGTEEVATFTSGKLEASLYVMVESLVKNPNQPPAAEEVLDLSLDQLEKNGAENILVKIDGFTIDDKVHGVKAHGRFTVKNQTDRAYELYLIDQPSALYQVLLVYPEDNEEMKNIKEHILESIEFKVSN